MWIEELFLQNSYTSYFVKPYNESDKATSRVIHCNVDNSTCLDYLIRSLMNKNAYWVVTTWFLLATNLYYMFYVSYFMFFKVLLVLYFFTITFILFKYHLQYYFTQQFLVGFKINFEKYYILCLFSMVFSSTKTEK